MRKTLNIRHLDEINFLKVQNAKRSRQYISNVINYDILTNPEYADMFFYSYMGRRVENASSDAICNILYKGDEIHD